MSRSDRGGDRSRADERRSRIAIVGAVLVGAATIVLAIGAAGNFPLSDDWSYAYTTQTWCQEGVLTLLPWTGATVVLQAWYGAVLCRIFGFSFTVLRLSTLFLATAGALGFALSLRYVGARGAVLVVATALFALNPLYVGLSFTFMTDVPCTVAAVWAGYAYLRGLSERRMGLLLAGSVCAAAALLIRQHGLLIAIAAALTALVDERPLAVRLRAAAAASVVPALVFVGFHAWLFGVHGPPAGYVHKLAEAQSITLASVGNCAFRGLMYLGLFVSPLLVGRRHPLHAWHPRLVQTSYAVVGLLAVGLLVRERALMFYLTNVVYDLGVGALTLRDTLFLGLGPIVQGGLALSLPLTLVAALGAARLAAAGAMARERLREPAAAFLTLAVGLLFLGTLLHTRYYFDRYLLLVLPFAIAMLVVVRPLTTVRPLGMVLTVGLALYAVAGTHDYMAWNRARFDGLTALEKSGVSPRTIDGGMEYNAWRFAPVLGTWPTDAEARPGQSPARRSWWWVIDDEFIASFRPLAGYTVHTRLPFVRWLPPGAGNVLILQRAPALP